MGDLLHPRPPVSGVPEDSRASRRIKPREGGPSERIAPKLKRIPALGVQWVVAQPGILLLAACMILLGLLVTDLLLRIGAVENADDWLPEWFAAHRTPFWDDASYYGSYIGDAPMLIPLVAGVVFVLVVRSRWRTATFVVQAGMAEFTAYGLTVLFISRVRPEVPRLDGFNPMHSFPSGHTAAAVAIYGSLGLLAAAHYKWLPLRIAIWTIAAAIPVIVAFSRMYRGMHHPIDVIAGALMGCAALLIALFAARTARAVAEHRAEKKAEETFA